MVRTRTLASFPCLRDAPGGFDAVEARHLDVHEHDVGPQPLRLLERGLAVRGLAHDLQGRLLAQERLHPCPEQGMVIAQQQAGPCGGSVLGFTREDDLRGPAPRRVCSLAWPGGVTSLTAARHGSAEVLAHPVHDALGRMAVAVGFIPRAIAR